MCHASGGKAPVNYYLTSLISVQGKYTVLVYTCPVCRNSEYSSHSRMLHIGTYW